MYSSNKKHNIHSFVASFLTLDINLKYSCANLHVCICQYINKNIVNKNIIRCEHDPKLFKLNNELKNFFNNCSLIAKTRSGNNTIIPEIMDFRAIPCYLNYCIVKEIDFYIPTKDQLEYRKYFLNNNFIELSSIIFSPDRISLWINNGITNVDITNFG